MQETTALRELRSRAPVTLASPAQALHIERLVQQVATALEGQRGGCPAGLDGTARGGVVIGVSEQFNIPVKYIGLGEKAEDLKLFDKKLFVQSLFQS